MGTDIHGVMQKKVAGGWEDVPTEYNENRHYQLFAVLAGVRNGYGFAGCPTGDAVTPIAQPRGLPEDFDIEDGRHPIPALEIMSKWRQKYHEEDESLEVWMGDHSHSWLSGQEMLDAFDHLPTITKTGILSREKYDRWDKSSAPSSYAGGVTGNGVVVIGSIAEAGSHPEWTHIRCTWQRDLKDELAYFFDEVRRLVELHGEVRYVFGFDS